MNPFPKEWNSKKTVEKSDLESGFNSDTRSSVFYFRNPMKVPIHRAMLFIKENKFERKVNIFFKNSSKEFELLGGGQYFINRMDHRIRI